MSPAVGEILEVLSSHAGQPVDFVALFMFLNTVAGGHYEERHTEAEIRAAVAELLAAGSIEATPSERDPLCRYTLAPPR